MPVVDSVDDDALDQQMAPVGPASRGAGIREAGMIRAKRRRVAAEGADETRQQLHQQQDPAFDSAQKVSNF